MEAVGAYIKYLRTQSGLGPKEIVERMREIAPDLDVPEPNYLWRIERAKIKKPSFELLSALTLALGGNPSDVATLLFRRAATAEEAQQMAQRWTEAHEAHARRIKETYERDAILARIDQLRREIDHLSDQVRQRDSHSEDHAPGA